jgi:hypothetical protein
MLYYSTNYSATASSSTSTVTNTWISQSSYGTGQNSVVSYGTDYNVTPRINNGKIALGQSMNIELSDGTIIKIEKDGSFRINDKNAKTTYKANRVKEFNQYINASDLLEDFIKEAGLSGVTQGQVLRIPIGVFIHWLIFKAAEKDGDPVPDNIPRINNHPMLPAPKNKPRCRWCGRFISTVKQVAGIHFCNGRHMDRFLEKQIQKKTG